MRKKKVAVWMKPLLAAVLCAATTIGSAGTVVIAEEGNGEPTATATTQPAETTQTTETTQPTDTETSKTNDEQTPADTSGPKTGDEQTPPSSDIENDEKQDKVSDSGTTGSEGNGSDSSPSDSQDPAPAKENSIEADESAPATEPKNKVTIAPAAYTDQAKTGFSAYLQAGKTKVDLTDTGDGAELTIGWADSMTLHIDAYFEEGSDKIIEISLPQGMTFNLNNYGNARYVTSDLTNFLKEKIVSTDQSDDAKKSQVILGEQQYNGTLTLKFFSAGDNNDVSHVSFDVTVCPAYFTSWNNQVWESGTAWFYDVVDHPVTVTQYMDGKQISQKSVKSLKINNDDTKQYGTSWTLTYNPEVLSGGQTSGGEYFYVRPIPGGGNTRQAAYKYFSITYFVPEHAEFVGFSSNGGKYCGVDPVVTTRSDTNTKTDRGDEIPEGYQALTWEFTDRIAAARQLWVAPIFRFPAEYFHSGEQATIRVGAVHAQYYGRKYAEGAEEPFDASKYPSLTYNILEEYEEVFANTYKTRDIDQEGNRNTNFYEADYLHYLGAPGFEHTQEQTGGYFIIGNRGLGDSVAKTITFSFDDNDTHAVGVTQMELPVFQPRSGKYHITDVQYRTWNKETNAVSDWQDYNWQDYKGTDSTINLKDIGVAGNSGTYLKAVRFDIDTIPKQAYLRTGMPDDGSSAYYYLVQVLTDDAIKLEKDGQIKNTMTIANKDGDQSDKKDTSGRSVYGYAFEGTTGKKLIYGNSTYYADPSSLQVGAGANEVVSYSHHYAQANAQLIDKIYLISPFGEDFTNIRMHYEGNWNKATINKKYYLQSNDSPQPEITTVDNAHISDELRAKYPNAIYYVVDFTGITDLQQVYDARQVGDSVKSSKSLTNTKYATFTPGNNPGLSQGVWLTYDYAPNIADPTGTYMDVSWVEFHTGDDLSKITYADNAWWNISGSSDIYHLTDKPDQKHLGRMNGFVLKPTEGLEVGSAVKQSDETDSWWRSYDGKGYDNNATVMRMFEDADYELQVMNYSSLPVSGMAAFFPVPKKGQNWGDIISPDGAFKFNMSLKKGVEQIPSGYRVLYSKNVKPSGNYADWDSYTWVDQADTAAWTLADWAAVNFVKVEWVGYDDHTTIDNGHNESIKFNLTVDTATTSSEEMNQVNQWKPYFSRTYKSGTSWVAGSPAAAMLVPGYLEGTVWEDTNGDGRRQSTEPAVSGAHVQLYDVSDPDHPVLRVDNQNTDADGKYRFDGLLDGTAASGWKDNCKIVVVNPSDDPSASAAMYAGFSPQLGSFENAMSMKAAEDQKTASITVTPDKDAAKNRYDCGLIRSSGKLTVTLKVEGKSPLYKEDTFDISVKLNSLEGNFPVTKKAAASNGSAAVNMLVPNQSSDTESFAQGETILSLKDQDAVTFLNLPAGEHFQIDASKYEPYFDVSYETSDSTGRADPSAGEIVRDASLNVTVLLKQKTKTLRLEKIDGSNGNRLANAKYTLSYEGNEITSADVVGASDKGTFTVSGEGIDLMNLIDGSYTLNEVQAPAGYVILNNAIHFAIKDGVFQIVDMNADSFATMETTDAGTVLRVKNLPEEKDSSPNLFPKTSVSTKRFIPRTGATGSDPQ